MYAEDERAVSEVIGFLFIFAILIVLLASYQAFLVPSANANIEFNHNQDVQGQLVDLRNSIQSFQSSGGSMSKTVDLGTNYPSRTFAINPTAPVGILNVNEFNSSSELVIRNAVGVNDDVKAYWNGTEQRYDTHLISYEPRYNEYQHAPITFLEHSIVYNEFDNGNQLTATDQRILQGNSIRLGTITGDRSYQEQKASLDLTPISTSMTRTTIIGDEGDTIEIDIPTNLNNNTWSRLLETEYTGQYLVGHSVDEVQGVLTLELDGAHRYHLQMAKTGIGSNIPSAEPAYLFRHSGHNQAIQEDQTSSVTVQVRDRYNNPVSDVDVEFDPDSQFEAVSDTTVTTDKNGIAEFSFTATNENDGDIVARVNDPALSDVTFRISVGPFDLGELGMLNPGDQIRLVSTDVEGDRVDLEFETVADDVDITEVRYNLHKILSPQQGSTPPDEITAIYIQDDDENVLSSNLLRGGQYEDLDPALTISGSSTTIELHFDSDLPGIGVHEQLIVITFIVGDDRIQILI